MSKCLRYAFLICFLLSYFSSFSYAFKNDSHEKITDAAIDLLVEKNLLERSFQQCIDPQYIKKALHHGVGESGEDAGSWDHNTAGDFQRYFFHFDPKLSTVSASCTASEWGFGDSTKECEYLWLNEEGNVQKVVVQNEHKWIDAVNSSDSQQGLVHLGYVLHLLEDMASPAHVRDDQHLTGELFAFEGTVEAGIQKGDIIPSYDSNGSLESLDPNETPDQFLKRLRQYTEEHFFSDDSCFKPGFS